MRTILIAAVLVPLIIMGIQAGFLWNQVWRETEKELGRTADAAAEHSLLALETHRIVLTRVNDILRGLSDEEIRARERELHDQLRRLLPELPLVQTVAVNDRNGRMLLTANVFPVPRDQDFSDREWIRDLRKPDAPKIHVSRVYVGRLDQFLFFAVSRRRTETGNGLPAETFDGAINISVQPNQLATGFAGLIGDSDDLVAMIRVDGQVLARRPGFAGPLPPIADPKELPSAVAAGEDRGIYRSRALMDDQKERLVAFRKLRGYPVYAVAGRDVDLIARRWVDSLTGLLAVGIPAMFILGLLALFAHRRTRDAQRANAALIEETARRAAAEAAKAAEARFHAIFESDPNGILAIDRSGRIRLLNGRIEKLFGYQRDELIGQPVELLVPARFRDHHAALRANFAAQPSTRPMGVGRDLYGLRKDGSEFPVEIGLSAFTTENDQMALANVADITERKRAAETEQILTRELEHRTSNLLAVIDAIAQRTLSGDHTLNQAKTTLSGRLYSLARAYRQLVQANWVGLNLNDLVRLELEPFAPRTRINGGSVMLSPTYAQNFSLALHELATNAAKYGALSVPDGEVRISWKIEGSGSHSVLKFQWRERGGPPADTPKRVGFGTQLLKTTLGEGRVEYSAAGFSYEVDLPIGKITPVEGAFGR